MAGTAGIHKDPSSGPSAGRTAPGARPGLYEEERSQRMRRAVHIGCLLGIVLVPAFGLLDVVAEPERLPQLLAIRFLCSLNLLACFFVNKSSVGERYPHVLAVYGTVSIAASIVWMTYLLGGPKSTYYAGVNLVVLVAGLITPMTVIEGMISCLAIYGTYLLASLPFLGDESLVFFYSNSFFMISTMAVVLFGFRFKERLARDEIQRRFELMEARRQLEAHSRNLENQVRQRTLDIIQALAYAIEAKDPYTRGHSERVKNYAVGLAERLGLPEREVLLIGHAAILHDIGKVQISGTIIQKPEQLTDNEYMDMMEHPALGEIMVEEISFLDEARPLIRHHHERWDGKGYPDGLKGKEIPIGARIIAISDIYDAITFQRPYREGTSRERAILHLRKEKGRSLDPDLVEAFIGMIHETA